MVRECLYVDSTSLEAFQFRKLIPGLGLPSQAARAMELGYDAVLLNTAVARAGDPAAMAEGFARAVEAGALAAAADPMEPRDMAAPSTPLPGRPFS